MQFPQFLKKSLKNHQHNNKTAVYTVLSVCLLWLLFVAGCSMGMSDILNAYNDNFISGALIKADNPDNEQFDESLMLLPHYAVRDDESLTLVAPPGCDRYIWKMFEKDVEYEIEDALPSAPFSPDLSRFTREIIPRAVNMSAQTFTFYVPETQIKPGTYKLTLEVERKFGKQSKTWSDYCTLIIFTPVVN